jgi:hypothetical protein
MKFVGTLFVAVEGVPPEPEKVAYCITKVLKESFPAEIDFDGIKFDIVHCDVPDLSLVNID